MTAIVSHRVRRNREPRRSRRCPDDPAAFGELATDLLYDFRGGRAGFSPEIVRELRVLREHFYLQSSQKT